MCFKNVLGVILDCIAHDFIEEKIIFIYIVTNYLAVALSKMVSRLLQLFA